MKAIIIYPEALLPAKISAARMTRRQWSRNSTPSGALDSAARSRISWNTGDSATLARTMTPTITSTKLNRNGIRQPQSM